MESLKKWLAKYGYAFEVKRLRYGQGSYEGVFVSLDILDKGRITGRVDERPILKYLRRYGLESEYRGYYSSLMIYKKKEAAA